MTNTREYSLDKSNGLSSPKLFLHTKLVPLAVNIAGELEVALDRSAARAGVRPGVLVAGAIALAVLMVLGSSKRPRKTRQGP